jgi:hypothetical protein
MTLERLKHFAQRLSSGKSEPLSQWGTPVTLDRGILGEAGLALDGQGFGSALWENEGSLWTMPIGPNSAPALVRLPMGEGTHPRIVVNSDGRGLALWLTEGKEEQQILGQILGETDTWARVIFRTGGRIHHLQAAMDRRGNALVVWLLEKDGRIEVMAQSFDIRTLAWEQSPTTLGIPSAQTAEPRIAVNHREHAMVLWEEEGTSQGLVASHYWPADGIWSDRPVSVVSHATCHHQVVIDDLGNALALWVQTPHGQRSSLEASFFDGLRSEWGKPEVLSSAQNITSPRLVMSGDGEALAAWVQAEGHGVSHLMTKVFGKGRWDSGPEGHELGNGPVKEFAMDLGTEGRAGLLTVHEGTGGDWVSVRLRNREWSNSLPLVSASKSPCSSPRLRLCPQGASAMWIQGAGKDRALRLAETKFDISTTRRRVKPSHPSREQVSRSV